MSSPKSYSVIGGGLAGTLTCLALVRRGQSVRWIIDPEKPACSSIAAGMYNPVTGKRFAKTWQVDVLQPFMEAYYRDAEALTNTRFLFPQPVMKLFTDTDEQARWEARKDDGDFQRLTRPLEPGDQPAGVCSSGLGGFVVPNAGSVRVATMLAAIKSYLSSRLEIDEGSFSYNAGIQNSVIHCEGWHGIENPVMQDIPFRHAHGDVLTIEAPGLDASHILNAGVYILPFGNDLFRVGATYDWNRLDPSPTQSGRNELETKLHKLLSVSFKTVDHAAGIRPATKRRTPVLGRLPGHPGHLVFNGLGSKGVLFAPYYAHQLVEHLLDGRDLDREVAIQSHL